MSLDLSSLNPRQREAVLATEGPLLVLAGAGSGKTRVITCRIAHLMEKGVAAKHILAVTFTNKAAAEMRERVSALVGEKRAEALTVCTFHAFGLQVLMKEAHRLGYPRRFAVMDAGDQASLVRRLLKETAARDRAWDVRRLVALLSRLKTTGEVGFADPDYEQAVKLLLPRYQRALPALACVDFDDLILLPAKLWKDDPELLEKYQDRFRYLLVDEYQDTNRAQFELLRLLAGERRNLCVVGDDDQSIYGWRGAEVEHIFRFDKQFKGAREVRLEQNYRSTGRILAGANAVIAGNKSRKAKKLWTDLGDGEPISVVKTPGEDEEAAFIADEILRIQYETHRKFADFAVLYRTNTQARPLEEAFTASKIRFETRGGQKFFDRKEIKDLVAYLRACFNPQDDVSVSRIVNTPARGIGETSMERLHARARQEGMHLFSVMKRADHLPDFPPAQAQAVLRFTALVERYAHRIRADGWSAAARDLAQEIGLRDEIRKSVESPAAAQRKLENLEALLAALQRFEEGNRAGGVAGWLARVALDSRDEEPGDDGGDAVVLMTLHSAKGLEFPVVFLAGVEEDLLPHAGMQGEPPNPDEERRLAYVGITRARQKLYLTRAATRFRNGAARPRTPSRFLQDLPASEIEEIDASLPRGPRKEAQMNKGRDFFARMKAMMQEPTPEAAADGSDAPPEDRTPPTGT